VVSVGSFDASYVPTIADFDRLDARFVLPKGTWDKLPQYHDYGFAVFKLKPGAHQIHPMAFEFPRADHTRLFFPTVHIHDGKVHARASFDHALYCQHSPGDTFSLRNWTESGQQAHQFMHIGAAKGLLLSHEHCYRLGMQGKLKNEDVWI
jgi:hypothetical protein